MIKKLEIENENSCLNKAKDDELLFVLLARDPATPAAIRCWCVERIRLGKNKIGDAQLEEALGIAEEMEKKQK